MRHRNNSSFFNTFIRPYPGILSAACQIIEREKEREQILDTGADITQQEIDEINQQTKAVAAHFKKQIERFECPLSKNSTHKLLLIAETIKKSPEFHNLHLVLFIGYLLKEILPEQDLPRDNPYDRLNRLTQGFQYQINQLLADVPGPAPMDLDEPGSGNANGCEY